MLRVHSIGGFSEVGKNMTVVETDDDAFIFDCGFHIPAVMGIDEKERKNTEDQMRHLGAIPNDHFLDQKGLRQKVRAIIPSHAHLDHIGGIPYLAHRYKADIISTPFTLEIIKRIYEDERIEPSNKLRYIKPNTSYMIKGKKRSYKLEFINVTHSTIQCSLLALHTPDGIVLYANDFKLDNTPVYGYKTDFEKLKRLKRQGIKVAIIEALYADNPRKTASEKVARSLLEDVMLSTDNKRSGIWVTTFSSHIARLKSIVDLGKKLDRQIFFLGRSLNKYVESAIHSGMCPFAKDVKLVRYRRQVERVLKKVEKDRTRYLIVSTGHQGEPGSVLDRVARNELHFNFRPNDHIIFSSSVIPTEISIANRAALDKRLKKRNVRMFSDLHVSGHAGREDLRDFINIIQPQHIIPSHAGFDKTTHLASLCSELGYKIGKEVHLMENWKTVNIK